MRIQIRNSPNETGFGIVVDPAQPPAVVRQHEDRAAVSLNWEQALDDERRLRRCPVCECPDLFARKEVPQLTAFVVLIFTAVVAMVLFGFGMIKIAIGALVVVALVDLAIFLFARRVLECYRCHSIFRSVPIRRGHPRWDHSLAERYQGEPVAAGSDGA